jgi:galactose mutarotase-like enzyme
MYSTKKDDPERNYGCRIREYIYKGLRVVHLENELLRISILADKGADIYEFVYKPKDVDFLWHSFNGLASPATRTVTCANPTGSFLDFYEGGWQELFPTIGEPCTYEGASVGVHGEIASQVWQYRILQDSVQEISVLFYTRTIRFPYLVTRTMTLKSNDARCIIEEEITNEGALPLEFMWGHHPAFGSIFIDETCEIIMGGQIVSVAKIIKGLTDYPVDQLELTGSQICLDKQTFLDLKKVYAPSSEVYMEYAVGNLTQGQYQIKNHQLGLSFQLEWDRELFPYVWVWAVYGGQLRYPWFGRAYTLALEPWSAIPGNLPAVVQKHQGVPIQPGARIKTVLFAGASTID